MSKPTTNQKGFSVVEALIVIVIVGLISAVGWLVYSRQKDSNGKQAAASTQVNQTNTGSEKSKLSKYKNDELGLSLSYPAEWGTASLADGPLSKVQSGKYKQLTFSKVANVSINFVTGPYSSPLDGCGYDDPVLDAQHSQNANQASVIGWDANNIKLYMMGQGFDSPTVYKQSKVAGDTGPGYTEISTSDKVLIYKDINNYPVKASSGEGCSPITQAQADEANAFDKFFHYAANYSNDTVFGVNGQFDARKGDNTTVRSELTEVLNTIQ